MATASATSLTFSDLIYVIFVTVWVFVAIFYKHAHSLWSITLIVSRARILKMDKIFIIILFAQ